MLGAGCPRVTHPFAARAPSPKGRASLDLHVLSTPPAFVLSQDQTLREGILTSDGERRFVDTESHRQKTVQSLVHPSCLCSSVPKESLHGWQCQPLTRVIYGTNFRHAVEFSRSGRAPSRPFRANRGQPETHYPVGSARSNTTGTARTPTWSGRLRGVSCLVLGGSSAWRHRRSSPGGKARTDGSVPRTRPD